MDRLWNGRKIFVSEIAIAMMIFMVGFIVGYPFGLFINKLDKKEKEKNVR